MMSSRHIDGDHKLIQPYKIVLHGGLDGFSRIIVFLQASTNNGASTVLQYFQSAVEHYNLSSRVRSDLGMENIEVAHFVLQERSLNRGSHITGKSVHNQRIEHLWCDVNRVIVSRFLNIFLFLEHSGILDPTDEVHLFCIHLVYIPLINDAINQFIGQWNYHPGMQFSPNQLWLQGMLHFKNSGYQAVTDVTASKAVYFDIMGLMKEGLYLTCRVTMQFRYLTQLLL